MDLSLRRTADRRTSARAAAESWFLERGLPFVLTTRARWRRLWPRTAPMLAAYATIDICGLVIFLIIGRREIQVDGEPTSVEWVVLAIIALALPLAAVVGWLVSRLPRRTRAVAATVAVVVATTTTVILDGPSQLGTVAIVVAAALILTGCGIGAVLVWAVRMTLSHLAEVGSMAVRALPVVLLTVLVFLNPYVWLMAATVSQRRLGLALLFLVTIASTFVVSGSLERVRPMLRSTAVLPKDSESLADTPFASMPDPPTSPRLTKTERLNVVFVLATSQLMQIMVVAVVIAAIFFVLGLILLSEPLLAEWTHGKGATNGTLLGMTLPVPQALIHTCLFLVALSFMYISARAVGDGEYRSTFLDPLIEDLHTTLIARNRYRGAIAAAGRDVDAADVSD
jgi:MFS family permease